MKSHLNRFLFFIAMFLLASSSMFGDDVQVKATQIVENVQQAVDVLEVQDFQHALVASSVNHQFTPFTLSVPTVARRRAVSSSDMSTRQTTLGVVGDALDCRLVFSATLGIGVPAGTVMIGLFVGPGVREAMPNMAIVVPPEKDHHGWIAQWNGAVPAGVTGFEFDFTGGGMPDFSVSTPVPAPTPDVELYPDIGKFFIRQAFPVLPVATINGNPSIVENGWITIQPIFYGTNGAILTLCSGFPKSECFTKVVDIPKMQ